MMAVSTCKDREMAVASITIQMEICMRGSGTMIRETVKESFLSEKEAHSLVHLRMMRPTMGSSLIDMKTHSKMILTREAISCMESSQDLEKLSSPTRTIMWESLEMV